MTLADSARCLSEAALAATDYLATLHDRRVAPDQAAIAGLDAFDHALDETPADPTSIIRDLHRFGSPATTATAGGRFFGLVVGGTLPAALGARVLGSAWDQVVFNDVLSPVGCRLERVAARWVLELLGLPSTAALSFVTGATMGNFTCLAAARQALMTRVGHDLINDGLRNAPAIRIVASEQIHVTVIKALTLLGLGKRDIEFVPVDEQGRIVPSALPSLDEQTVVCVQAGNVNSGACDPFAEICARAREGGAWVHVDGAFGLWAAASRRRRHLTAGIELADSWVTDGHKWLNTPYDCGLAIVREGAPLHEAMATQAPYLRAGATIAPKDMAPEFSRSARGLEVWAAIKSLGRGGIEQLIDRTCDRATQFAEGLRRLGFEVLNDVVLNQVVAAVGTSEEHAKIVADVQTSGVCWFGPTTWKGRNALRFSVSNWATSQEDVELSLQAISAAMPNIIG